MGIQVGQGGERKNSHTRPAHPLPTVPDATGEKPDPSPEEMLRARINIARESEGVTGSGAGGAELFKIASPNSNLVLTPLNRLCYKSVKQSRKSNYLKTNPFLFQMCFCREVWIAMSGEGRG
jgi:hypothetical protein